MHAHAPRHRHHHNAARGGSLLGAALPALAGFAFGRMTAPRYDAYAFGYGNPYAPYQPPMYAAPYRERGLGSHVLTAAATVGGWYAGRNAGHRLEHGGVGAALDQSGFGAWYSSSPISGFTGGRASGLLRPVAGFAGALLGSWLTS